MTVSTTAAPAPTAVSELALHAPGPAALVAVLAVMGGADAALLAQHLVAGDYGTEVTTARLGARDTAALLEGVPDDSPYRCAAAYLGVDGPTLAAAAAAVTLDPLGWAVDEPLARALATNPATPVADRLRLLCAVCRDSPVPGWRLAEVADRIAGLLAHLDPDDAVIDAVLTAGVSGRSVTGPLLADHPRLSSRSAGLLLDEFFSGCRWSWSDRDSGVLAGRPDLVAVLLRDERPQVALLERLRQINARIVDHRLDDAAHSCAVLHDWREALTRIAGDPAVDVTVPEIADELLSTVDAHAGLVLRTDLDPIRLAALLPPVTDFRYSWMAGCLAANPSCPTSTLEGVPLSRSGYRTLARVASDRFGDDPVRFAVLARLRTTVAVEVTCGGLCDLVEGLLAENVSTICAARTARTVPC
jgi:hypothetical protein